MWSFHWQFSNVSTNSLVWDVKTSNVYATYGSMMCMQAFIKQWRAYHITTTCLLLIVNNLQANLILISVSLNFFSECVKGGNRVNTNGFTEENCWCIYKKLQLCIMYWYGEPLQDCLASSKMQLFHYPIQTVLFLLHHPGSLAGSCSELNFVVVSLWHSVENNWFWFLLYQIDVKCRVDYYLSNGWGKHDWILLV